MPQLYMIGGPNGAGKTTVSMTLLPELLNCHEYVNADTIAAALSPFAPETIAIQAGRLMLQRIHQLADQGKDFAFETTISSRSFAPFLKQCQQRGYKIILLYVWLEDDKLAVARVHERVQNGGHSIPDHVVLRRYKRSIDNFLNIYALLANRWLLYDNSFNLPKIIAQKDFNQSHQIIDQIAWNKFKGMQ